jgi:hypothetical protein
MKKAILLLVLLTLFTFSTFFTFSTSFAEDSTLRLVEKDMFPPDKQIKCASCGKEILSSMKYCPYCGAATSIEEVNGDLFVRAGSLIPGDSGFRDNYGSSVLYGFGLDVYYSAFGMMLEFENYSMDALSPVSTGIKASPVEGDWNDVNARISFTPIWVSVYLNQSLLEWKAFVGIGMGTIMIRQEFKGDVYMNGAFRYTDIISNDSLLGYQFFIGVVKSSKIGFEIKYSIIPTNGKFAYPFLGGLSATVNMFF